MTIYRTYIDDNVGLGSSTIAEIQTNGSTYGVGISSDEYFSRVAIATNTTNQSQFLTYATQTGNVSGLGVTTTGLVFNPSSGNLGIGTTTPASKLHVIGDVLVSGILTASSIVGASFNGVVERFFENINISSTQLTGTVNLDILNVSLFYYTANSIGNWTFNIRGNSSTTLNNILPIGKSATVTVLSTQGASPNYANGFAIDGSSVAPKWINGTVPNSGYASSINIYTYVILKTADSIYTVIGSLSKFS